MKQIKLLSILLSISFMIGCGYSEEFKEINYENQFIVAIPDYMEECDDFEASYQFKNAYRNTYGLVNVEDKNGRTLAEFQKEKADILKGYELLSRPLVTDSSYRDEADFKAIDIKLYGVMDNENIYYWHTAVESDGKFFEIVCWTRSMDRKQRYGGDLEKIIASFKPLI